MLERQFLASIYKESVSFLQPKLDVRAYDVLRDKIKRELQATFYLPNNEPDKPCEYFSLEAITLLDPARKSDLRERMKKYLEGIETRPEVYLFERRSHHSNESAETIVGDYLRNMYNVFSMLKQYPFDDKDPSDTVRETIFQTLQVTRPGLRFDRRSGSLIAGYSDHSIPEDMFDCIVMGRVKRVYHALAIDTHTRHWKI